MRARDENRFVRLWSRDRISRFFLYPPQRCRNHSDRRRKIGDDTEVDTNEIFAHEYQEVDEKYEEDEEEDDDVDESSEDEDDDVSDKVLS